MAIPLDVRAHVAEQGLTERSSWRATVRTAAVVGLYAALAAVAFRLDNVVVWLAAWCGQGAILVGSYSAMHEAAHGTLYRSKRANRIAGVLWASTILVNWSLWRSFHLQHHAHTGTDQDPKLKHKLEITRRRQYALLPVGGLAFMGDLWVSSGKALFASFPAFTRNRPGRWAIRFDAVLLLLVTAGLVGGSVLAPGLVLRLWVAPLLVTFGVALAVTGMSEHYGCALDGNAFATTRTVISNRLFRYLVWNNNFHVAHHLVPSVPFHHAPALHRYIEPRTEHLERSYLSFHLGILRSCRR